MSDLTQILLGFDARQRIFDGVVRGQPDPSLLSVDRYICWSLVHSNEVWPCWTDTTPLFLFGSEEAVLHHLHRATRSNNSAVFLCAFTVLNIQLPSFMHQHRSYETSIPFSEKEYYFENDATQTLQDKKFIFRGYDVADPFFLSIMGMDSDDFIAPEKLVESPEHACRQCEIMNKIEPPHAPFFAFGIWTKEIH